MKAIALIVTLEIHKRTEHDRGTKKVLVNGEQWGWVTTTWHGRHGTKFHLLDMFEAIHKPADNRPGRMTQVVIRCPDKRDWVRENVGKPQPWPKMATSESVILDMVNEAIRNEWLRSPATRAAEVKSARDASARATAKMEQKAETEWNKKIDRIMELGLNLSPDSRGLMARFEIAPLRLAISEAMKWAQVQ